MKSKRKVGADIVIVSCDVKENTDTRLVVDFPKSHALTPDLALGQPGQVARFEFSKSTKKNARLHGRRADVTSSASIPSTDSPGATGVNTFSTAQGIQRGLSPKFHEDEAA